MLPCPDTKKILLSQGKRSQELDHRESERKRTETTIPETRDSLDRMKLPGVRRMPRLDSKYDEGWCVELGGPAGKVSPRMHLSPKLRFLLCHGHWTSH